MAISLAIFLLVPLCLVNAAPPTVRISNGEIQPVGTANACSTITTTIGARVDYIPVPCSALPPVFTEEVIANGTSVSLVIGPSGDVSFENEPWLSQVTIFATPSSQSASRPSNRTASTSISSQTGSSISRSQITSSSYTSAPSDSLSLQSQSLDSGNHTLTTTSGTLGGSPTSQTQSQSPSSPIKLSYSNGASKSSFFTNMTVSPLSVAMSATGKLTGTSANPSSTGASGSLSSSLSSSVPSGNAPASNIPSIASSSTPTSKPRLSSAAPQTSGETDLSIRSHSLPIGSISSQSSGTQARNSTHTSAENSSSTQSRSLESLSPGSSRDTLTASPASSTISIPSPTTTSRTFTSGLGGTHPDFPSSAFVPVATPITSLDPIGPVVKSSASAVQSSISVIIPLIQSYISEPTCDSCSTDAINALKEVLPIIEDLSDTIGPGPSPKPCSASQDLLSDIFNAVKCAAQNVENAISHVEGGEDDIDDLESDVTNLNDLQKPLDNDDEDDDDESKSASSQSQSSPTQSQSSSKTSASQSSSMTSLTASTVSANTSSSSLTTVSSSTGSCALPPQVTLPPDSLTGPSQPDQPTSVVVTGLPTSATRSSKTLTTGPTTTGGTSATALNSASQAMVTAQPLCVPYQNPEGGDGGVINCNVLNLCECSTGTITATYTTMSGTDQCGYTQLPSSTWDGQNICTMGMSASASSASALHPPSPVTSGQIIYTDTVLMTSEAGTILYGCTSTTTGPGWAGFESTGCVGSKTPLTTILPPVITPTGAPDPTPSCNKPCNPQDASCNGDTTGYVPNPVFFEAAIGVFCGPDCQGKSGCLSATGATLDAQNSALYANFPCSTAKTSPGGNSSLDCEPNDWEHNPPPYWEASGINFNIGIKLIDKNCQWTIDAATCKKDLSNTLTGCPAAGLNWNECVAWTVGAGAKGLSLSAWEAEPVPTGSSKHRKRWDD